MSDEPVAESVQCGEPNPSLRSPFSARSGRGFPLRDRTAPPIAFNDLPEFTASYEVRGQDETRIRGVLDRFVRTRLAVHVECWIEGKGSELLCGRSVDYTQAGERDAFFLVAREIRALFEKG